MLTFLSQTCSETRLGFFFLPPGISMTRSCRETLTASQTVVPLPSRKPPKKLTILVWGLNPAFRSLSQQGLPANWHAVTTFHTYSILVMRTVIFPPLCLFHVSDYSLYCYTTSVPSFDPSLDPLVLLVRLYYSRKGGASVASNSTNRFHFHLIQLILVHYVKRTHTNQFSCLMCLVIFPF